MRRHVAQCVNTTAFGFVNFRASRIGADVVVEASLSPFVLSGFLGCGLVRVLKPTLIGNFALLTMATRPLAVALVRS